MSHEEGEFKKIEFKVTIKNYQTDELRIEFVKAKFDFEAYDLVTLNEDEGIYFCDKYVPYKGI
jgi:hypothetical protein